MSEFDIPLLSMLTFLIVVAIGLRQYRRVDEKLDDQPAKPFEPEFPVPAEPPTTEPVELSSR